MQDGRWGHAPNLPTKLDGGNLNNWVAVPYRNTDPAVQVGAAWQRALHRACWGRRAQGRFYSPVLALAHHVHFLALSCFACGPSGHVCAATGFPPPSLSLRQTLGQPPVCLSTRPPACPPGPAQEARQRLLTPGGRLTPEEVERIQAALLAMEPTGGGSTGNLSSAE